MNKYHEIKKIIIKTHKSNNDCDLLLDLKIIDIFDRESNIISKDINIGDEITISFGIDSGIKIFKKDKYN